MGLFGYSFVNLTKDQVHARRILLDHYAFVAQVSILAVLVGILLYRLSSWVNRRNGEDEDNRTPSSPYLKAVTEYGRGSWIQKARLYSARVRWRMGDEVMPSWGTKGEWVCGGLWLLWLLILCIKDTGEDYMHLTKRFGIVAASQLPLHYLLAMKSTYSPLQILTRMSHEKLNAAHQMLGRIIQCLLALHAVFYLNFFIRVNVLSKRIKDVDVIIGIICVTIIMAMSTTAISAIRKWNYRVFYTIHVVSATVFLPLVYFHVSHIRPFILESGCIYVLHFVLRMINRGTQSGSMSLVPGTELVYIDIPVNSRTRQLKPGQHVYFSLPHGYHTSAISNLFLHNPFTVASLPKKDGRVVLVARALGGNTRQLANLARQADLQHAGQAPSLPLRIEGPYGSAAFLPALENFSRILLVAGGVGATFILPILRTVLESKQNEAQAMKTEVRFVWAVRSTAETSWALLLPELPNTGKDVEMEVYSTAASSIHSLSQPGEAMELTETDALMDTDNEKALSAQGIAIKHGRPDLHDIVDDVFSGHGGRVAVFVCGPTSMFRQLRREVRREVYRGRDVYWHAEEFGL